MVLSEMCNFCLRELAEKQALLHQSQVCDFVSAVSRHKNKVREDVHKFKKQVPVIAKMVHNNHLKQKLSGIALFIIIEIKN